MSSKNTSLETINQSFKSALGIAKMSGLTGNKAIQVANDLVVKELGVSPLGLCMVELDLTTDIEVKRKKAIHSLGLAGSDGIKPLDMPTVYPWSTWTKKERLEVLNELLEDGLICKVKVKTGKRGPGTLVWVLK